MIVATICTAGRTANQFASEGTGTMLAIQNGPTPSSLMRIPMREDHVLNGTNFKQGKCFYAMGMFASNMVRTTCSDSLIAVLYKCDCVNIGTT